MNRMAGQVTVKSARIALVGKLHPDVDVRLHDGAPSSRRHQSEAQYRCVS